MKVIAINGSPRKDGNTHTLLSRVCSRLEQHGIETETIRIGGKAIRGCTACGMCFKNKDQQCIIKTDDLNDAIAKMIAADGILLGSPTYFSDVSAEMKALIDRTGYVTLANGSCLAGKVGAAVSAVRRAGAQHTINTMHHFFSISQMPIATSTGSPCRPRPSMKSRRCSPAMYSITKKGKPSWSPKEKTCATFGWRTLAIADASRRK